MSAHLGGGGSLSLRSVRVAHVVAGCALGISAGGWAAALLSSVHANAGAGQWLVWLGPLALGAVGVELVAQRLPPGGLWVVGACFLGAGLWWVLGDHAGKGAILWQFSETRGVDVGDLVGLAVLGTAFAVLLWARNSLRPVVGRP